MQYPSDASRRNPYDYAKIRVCLPPGRGRGPIIALSMVLNTADGMEAMLDKSLPTACAVYFQHVDQAYYRITMIEWL